MGVILNKLIADKIESKIDTISYIDSLVFVQDTTNINKVVLDQIQTSSEYGNFEIISVVSGAIAALAAMIAVILTFLSNKQERKSKRPYFTLKEPGFKRIDNGSRLQVTFINCGMHPAKQFKGELKFIEENFQNENNIKIDVVNDIPADLPTPYYDDNIVLEKNMPVHFIYCKISYEDPILHKDFEQEFFMKWGGVQNGSYQPDFVHMNSDEKKDVETYLRINTK